MGLAFHRQHLLSEKVVIVKCLCIMSYEMLKNIQELSNKSEL